MKYNGISAQVDLGFDESKVLDRNQIEALKQSRPDLAADVDFKGTTRVPAAKIAGRTRVPLKVMACGGTEHLRPEGAHVAAGEHDS